MEYVCAFHAIEELLRTLPEKDLRKAALFVAKSGPRAKKIAALASGKKVAVRQIGEDDLKAMLPKNSGADFRGVALAVEKVGAGTQKKIAFDEFLSAAAANPEKPCLVVALDGITDPHNVGAILRSAALFGCEMALVASRGTPLQSEVVARASAGASSHVRLAAVANLAAALERLKEAGFWIYAADMSGGALESVQFAPKAVVVMGAEGSGLSRTVRKQCDEFVKIRTTEKIDSLNVSVAAGIILHAIFTR